MTNDVSSISSLSGYACFRAQVQHALGEAVKRIASDTETINHHLNGGASEALEKYVDRTTRSEFGIFFSGRDLSSRVASLIKERLAAGASIADPTCGAGDLLLACLSHAGTESTLDATLASWSGRALGIDIHDELVKTARERLALLAAARLHELHVPMQ